MCVKNVPALSLSVLNVSWYVSVCSKGLCVLPLGYLECLCIMSHNSSKCLFEMPPVCLCPCRVPHSVMSLGYTVCYRCHFDVLIVSVLYCKTCMLEMSLCYVRWSLYICYVFSSKCLSCETVYSWCSLRLSVLLPGCSKCLFVLSPASSKCFRMFFTCMFWMSLCSVICMFKM